MAKYHPVQLNTATHSLLKQQAASAHRSMAAHIAHLLEQEQAFTARMAREGAEFLRVQHQQRDEADNG